MPTYVSSENWTDQGIRTVMDIPERVDSATQLAQKYGCSLQLYRTMGPYDVVYILEAPDDESASALLLEVGSLGNVKTTTFRAYDLTDWGTGQAAYRRRIDRSSDLRALIRFGAAKLFDGGERDANEAKEAHQREANCESSETAGCFAFENCRPNTPS